MLKINYKGYEISQASNNDIMICKDNKMMFHAQGNRKLNKEELKKELDAYLKLKVLIDEAYSLTAEVDNENKNGISKLLNAAVTRNKFEDKPLDNYIYASLSQPPIKILDKRNSNDELDYIVECPNCHSAVCYGTDIFMYSGHIYCSNKGCREEVVERYERGKYDD